MRYPSLPYLIGRKPRTQHLENLLQGARPARRAPDGGVIATDSGIERDMKSLMIAVTQRLQGERPSAIRAFAGAAVAGAASGALVYKVLRS